MADTPPTPPPTPPADPSPPAAGQAVARGPAAGGPATPAPAPAPNAAELVTIRVDQLQALLALPARIAEMEDREAARERAAQEQLIAEQVRAGKAEEAVQTLRRQSEAAEATL